MVHFPTFTINLGEMQANILIPYMEHLGYDALNKNMQVVFVWGGIDLNLFQRCFFECSPMCYMFGR